MSVAQCAATVRWGWDGLLHAPRPCSRPAKPGGSFCGLHRRLLANRPEVTSTEGGWCIWCTQPGCRYLCSRDPRVTIVFCDPCAGALARSIASDAKVLRSARVLA